MKYKLITTLDELFERVENKEKLYHKNPSGYRLIARSIANDTLWNAKGTLLQGVYYRTSLRDSLMEYEWLSNTIKTQCMDEMNQKIMDYYEVTSEDLSRKKSTHYHHKVRSIIWFFTTLKFELSSKARGAMFNRDPSNSTTGIRKIESQLGVDKVFMNEITHLIRFINMRRAEKITA